jgi:hypothetical protein
VKRDTTDGFILLSREFKIGVKGEEGKHPCRYDAKSPLLLVQGKKEQMELGRSEATACTTTNLFQGCTTRGLPRRSITSLGFCSVQSGRLLSAFLKETVLSMRMSLSHLAC